MVSEKNEKEEKLCFDLAVPYDMGQCYEKLQKEIEAELLKRDMCHHTEIRFDGKI